MHRSFFFLIKHFVYAHAYVYLWVGYRSPKGQVRNIFFLWSTKLFSLDFMVWDYFSETEKHHTTYMKETKSPEKCSSPVKDFFYSDFHK